MATVAARGSGTPATTGTTWANVTNAVNGTAGTNPATYATMTSTTTGAVATMEVTGYGFSSSVGAADTLNSVTVNLRHFENNTGRFASVRFQPYDGATAIGSIFTATMATAARNDSTTFPVTLAQLRSSTFKIRVTITGAASTQSRVFSIDQIDVTADYTVAPTAVTGTGTGTLTVTATGTGVRDMTGTGTGGLAVAGEAAGQAFTFVASGTRDLETGVARSTEGDVARVFESFVAPGVRVLEDVGGRVTEGDVTRVFESYVTAAAVTGVATGAVTLSGSATGIRGTPATGTGTVTLSGTAAGTKTVTATATGSLALSGAAAGVRPMSGTATASITLGGTATGTRSTAGTATGAVTLAGVSTGTVTVTAAATGAITLSGTGSGVRGRPGAATGAVTVSGTAAGVKTVTGVASSTLTLSGTSSGQKAVTGTATGAITVSSLALGLVEGNAVGTATASITLGGTASGVRGTPGTAAAAVALSGTAVGRRSTAGAATASLTLSGTATGQVTVTATAVGALTVQGVATGARTVTATATGYVALSGTATGGGVTVGIEGEWNDQQVIAMQWGTEAVVDWFMLIPTGTASSTITLTGTAAGVRDTTGTATGTVTLTGVAVGVGETPAPTYTDVLFEDFANFTDAPWTTTANCTIVAGRTGTAAQIVGSSAQHADYTIPALNESDTITVGFAFRWTDGNSLARDLIRFNSDTGATQHIRVAATSGGAITFSRSGTGLGNSATGIVVANTWYYIEVQTKLADSPNGTGTVRLNGTEVINVTTVNTKNLGTKTTFDQIRLGGHITGATHQYDDLYITTGAGAPFKGDITV